MTRERKTLGSAGAPTAGDGALAIANFSGKRALGGKRLLRRGAATSTRGACAPRIVALAFLGLTALSSAGTLQEKINSAAPNDTLTVAAAVHPGSITIAKPLTLLATPGAEIRGNGVGNVITINADDVTLRGFRITGSGLRLSDDNAAIFVTGHRATIDSNVIENSLHGVYLKKVRGARILGNRIRGKTTLRVATGPVAQTLTTGAGELCDVALDQNRRGNGIHQWNCERILISGNEISDARDGIYFSFTNHSRVENNHVHHVRYGLHYMYSDNNTFENNVFAQNAAGAAVMFSRDLIIRGNEFIDNRGSRAYGILFQSDERVRLENNTIRNNAVGLSFQQAIGFVVRANDVSGNYIGLRFYGNSDDNSFSENRFTQNLHPIDSNGHGSDNRWAVAGVGNFWSGQQTFDLNGDGVNDLPHRELDLTGPLRRDFPTIAFLSGSPVLKLLRFAHDRAALPGVHSIDDPAPLTTNFWTIRARRALRKASPNE